MNEGTKTGIFWAVAVVMLAIATLVAWPTSSENEDNIAGQFLFKKFSDPLAAASMKIVTFDEEQGQLQTFEVRKDRESELWTIPSRDGYPADALDQMKNAANSLVGLKILDIQTSNAEDHDDLGVSEPKLEDLEVGDDGVGRLVIFKDESQATLASLIIGDQLSDDPEKRYVRIPSQDPIYVVRLDESPLTTKFQEWIEDDLLQLSSIDIADMEIKDYSASLNIGGQISLTRNYAATVEMDGSQWKLDSLIEYDPKNPMADPTPVEVGEDETLNKTKLDAIKNALDDLKIADVVRKPEGMSANLRANQDLLADKDAVGSLAQRGFYPVPAGPNGEIEILSANGELNVALNDGVKYILRFGNIAGVTEKEDSGESEGDAEEVETGVNRYLLVTTVVDHSKFPVPDLKDVPQTLEELDAILNPKTEEGQAVGGNDSPVGVAEIEKATEPAEEGPAEEGPAKEGPAKEGPAKEGPAEEGPAEEEPAEEEPAKETVENKEEPAGDKEPAATDSGESEAAEESQPTGETETSGSGEATGKGEAQEPSAKDGSEGKVDSDDAAKDADDKSAAVQAKPSEQTPAAEKADQSKPSDEELTEEEKLERLEAEQEKITKENQRKLDERKDKLEAAEGQVRSLNARFADWYYVIPEDTYAKLRIKRDELFEQPGAGDSPSDSPLNAAPQFNFPGLPGN